MNPKSIFTITSFLIILITASVQISTAQKPAEQIDLIPQASTTIVFSQVYSGGGGSTGTYLHDYVELKNISSSPQSLNGLSLMYGSATGQFGSVATNVLALPNVALASGQYFLVELSTAGTAGAALPVTPDVSSTNLSMAAASGKVALTNGLAANSCGATATPCTLPNAQIVDLVSWGASNNAEGGVTVNNGVALASTQGSVRKSNGCQDTDNNNADFDVISSPVPRNSATTPGPCGAAPTSHAALDFDGDGKTDFAITRDVNGSKQWWVSLNSSGAAMALQWGIDTDEMAPADYDGDGKTDVAVWRSGAPNQAAFYILQSQTSTLRTEIFGQTGDSPRVVRDYDGDGKADVSVYRAGQTPGSQSFFFYRGSLNNPSGNITYVPWGISGDTATQGDYDGDGKGDFCIRRNINGAGWFIIQKASGGVEYINWGLPTDGIVPCDFDGDAKSDLCVARVDANNNFNLYVLTRTGGGTGANPIVFARDDLNDSAAFGDYDGDGKTDIGIWRPGTNGLFWIRLTSSGNVIVRQWGLQGDEAVGEWNTSQ